MIETSNPNLFYGLILGVVIYACIIFYRKLYPGKKEFFSQQSSFILRQNNEKYDPFYLDYYDELYKTSDYSTHDYDYIMSHHAPTRQSIFLDIGCGTGHLIELLEKDGYTVFGVDKSRYMVEQCQEGVKDCEVYCEDVLSDPMLYENNSFSHITCTHFTIYEMENKATFFKHCYSWLQCGGYLVVHLVDPDKFKKTVPSVENNDSMITNTSMDFKDYTYKNNYKSNDEVSILTETFTDKYTDKVRQNEMKLFMEPKTNIIETAMKCGFVTYHETSYKGVIEDSHQYLVTFLKPLCGDN